MIIARPLIAWLLFATLNSTALGAGITYPDGTVSPFSPGFFGIGHLQPYERSEANGVAAAGGLLLGVVGFLDDGPTGYLAQAVFHSGNGSLLFLPGSGANASVAWAISSDALRKAGDANGPAMWDASLNYMALPLPPGFSGAATRAISATGAAIVGHSITTGEPTTATDQATRWPTDGSAPTLLGFLSGYGDSRARGVSADGQVICGLAFNGMGAPEGASIYQRPFRKAFTSPMQDLGTLSGHTDAMASGISSDGNFIVGESQDRATGRSSGFVWTNGSMFALSNIGGSAAVGAALAVTADTSNQVAVGFTGPLGDAEAVRWTRLAHVPNVSVPERIAALLTTPYKNPLPRGWRLIRATGISEDGYTVCGVGYDPNGRTQGWVAVLPPILSPPFILGIPPQRAELNNPFSFQIEGTFLPGDSFSAKGLPTGFQINSVTGKITGTWNITQANPGSYTVTVFATRPGQGTGNCSFTLELPSPSSIKQIIKGLGFLPYPKPPGETFFPESYGLALSANGQVAAGDAGPSNDRRAFRWSAQEGMTALPILEGAFFNYSNAYAASANGRVIVGEATNPATEDGPGTRVAVMWNTTSAISSSSSASSRADALNQSAAAEVTVTNLGVIPGGTISVAHGVSADGTVVVGYGSDFDPDVPGSGTRQAFRWTAAQGMVGLGWLPGGAFGDSSTALAVSAGGSIVVGVSSAAGGTQAFRWTQAQGMTGLGLPSGASDGRGTGISGDNSTIIGQNRFSNRNRAFRWTSVQGMTQLGFLAGDDVSEAYGVNLDGSVIVGRSALGFNPSRAFIWDAVNGMRDLKSVLVAGNPNLANWSLRTADGISSDGKTITGDAVNPNGDSESYTAYLSRVAFVGAVSRKIHGATAFDIDLPLVGDPGIECRSGGASGDYQVIFSFADTISSVGNADVTDGTGSVSSRMMDADTHKYIVNLTGVTNAQVITVILTSVIDSAGNSSSSVPISVGLLQGDTTGNGSVNSTDVSQTKSKSGQVVNASNFRADVTVSGSINSTDVSAVKSKSGTGLSLSQAATARP